MNTSEPQIITVRPSAKHTELKWFLGLLLLVSVAGYLHWTLGKVLAWWLLIFLVTSLSLVLIVLGLWLWRVHNQSKSRTKLEQEYLRQEQEKTVEMQVSRLKAEAELQEAKAKASKAEREAEFSYIVAGHDDAILVRETNFHAVWRPSTLILASASMASINRPPCWNLLPGSSGRPGALHLYLAQQGL